MLKTLDYLAGLGTLAALICMACALASLGGCEDKPEPAVIEEQDMGASDKLGHRVFGPEAEGNRQMAEDVDAMTEAERRDD